jgi:hypothetical protein
LDAPPDHLPQLAGTAFLSPVCRDRQAGFCVSIRPRPKDDPASPIAPDADGTRCNLVVGLGSQPASGRRLSSDSRQARRRPMWPKELPRAYRLKASIAAPSSSTSTGTFPHAWCPWQHEHWGIPACPRPQSNGSRSMPSNCPSLGLIPLLALPEPWSVSDRDFFYADAPLRNPITTDCCARAGIGHATVAPPTRVTTRASSARSRMEVGNVIPSALDSKFPNP